ncbi:hypothetical protein CMV_007230 [Castanea mollissima]|uniref:Uncharacterized protein n=2 Tax=Castanea mollissima TaxID=60419 RepID=A0A8J4RV89_9ROSI|nr:hypothetical protein CMV_007230 [Castanea mollissima]
MRSVALALVLMMVSSCLATNRKTLMVEMHEQEQRQLIDQDISNPNDNNDHHAMPRQDSSPYKHDNGNSGVAKAYVNGNSGATIQSIPHDPGNSGPVRPENVAVPGYSGPARPENVAVPGYSGPVKPENIAVAKPTVPVHN